MLEESLAGSPLVQIVWQRLQLVCIIRIYEYYYYYHEARERSEPFFPWFSEKKKPLHNGSYEDRVPKIKNKTFFCMCV